MPKKTISSRELRVANVLSNHEEVTKAIHAVFTNFIMHEMQGGWGPISHKETEIYSKRGEIQAVDVNVTMWAQTTQGDCTFNITVSFHSSDEKNWIIGSVGVEGNIPSYNHFYHYRQKSPIEIEP